MTRKGFFSQKSFFVPSVVLTAITAGAFLVPALNAGINETMPAKIPSEILADCRTRAEQRKKLEHLFRRNMPRDATVHSKVPVTGGEFTE